LVPTPVSHSELGPIRADGSDLAHCEQVIERGLAHFIEVGNALLQIGPALKNIAATQRAYLTQKLVEELGPSVIGLTTPEILEKVRAAVDDICATFRENTLEWAASPSVR
jgi:hypothetical protein